VNRRTCLITGTTHGIGRVTARGIASAGYRVVMACRDINRANRVRDEIATDTGNRDIHVLPCDLASLDTVRVCADAFEREFGDLHLLINNAATMTTTRQTSPDGIELTFAVNYLGPYLLTRLLLPRMTGGQNKIVNVASNVHGAGGIDPAVFDESAQSGRFRGLKTYANSKLAMVMFTLSLSERLTPAAVTVNCLHPGVVSTNITNATNLFLRIGMKIASPVMFGEERGAKTTLHVALDPALDGVSGKYFNSKQRIAEPAPNALDPDARAALWHWSEAACGLVDAEPAGTTSTSNSVQFPGTVSQGD
jgi:NAD(P)-dependent dehydrogenase (short-subunit alcohol dehydrogenase family)